MRYSIRFYCDRLLILTPIFTEKRVESPSSLDKGRTLSSTRGTRAQKCPHENE
ncbi:hypothetical protein [Calothrix sp. CCY 0018]|uniref:hypothetical protein n=1 Tax=Calothrix sp. CCY 0018 TaxID=3103864 RepID=UPI0039C5DCE2